VKLDDFDSASKANMATSGSGAPVESEGDAIAEPAPAVTGDVVEEAAPASNDANDDENFSPSVIPVPELPFPDGQSAGSLVCRR
jgi:hypothetical protein